ncbi:DUF4123 domain-containing protein [Vibrio sp. SCSIO 43132]|uniref:DUF4123 domain-containing protein n=1 Tax=Vibrio sp. SCSIO 43132 TaxID=2779363 RepID=UPI001CA7E4E4|nr:DUF4123 domain-containing protein [Vibrio sp. SCSIO 43132]UAB69798.1 DUF4123 domain-containing protein [Vibrio sp. SCSIO 43132]
MLKWFNENEHSHFYWLSGFHSPESEKWQNMDVPNFSLFDGEHFPELSSMSPVLWDVSSVYKITDSRIWMQGILFATPSSSEDLLKHLRTLLVSGYEGEEVFFRFYDPEVLGVMLSTFSTEEVGEFLGCIHAIALTSKGREINKAHSPAEEWEHKDAPWWTIRKPHLEHCYSLASHATNIEKACWQWMPELVQELEEPKEKITALLKFANSKGLRPSDSELYVIANLTPKEIKSEMVIEHMMLDDIHLPKLKSWRGSHV